MVEILDVIYTSDASLRLLFASDKTAPTFYVYVNGRFFAATGANNVLVHYEEGSSPVIEVFDDPEGIPQYAAPNLVDLVVTRDATHHAYRVEQLDGTWTEVRRYEELDGAVASLAAIDASLPTRIVAESSRRPESDPLVVAIATPRHPDPPTVLAAYNETTRQVTLTEET